MEKKDQKGGGFHGYQIRNTDQQSHMSYAAADKECREQDRFMPIANVIRLMRRIIPSHAKISDDAKETIQECVSEFISFVTSEANMRCHQERRRTITAEDVLWAMNNLGFDDYIEPLTIYLNRLREIESGERNPLLGMRSIEHRAMGIGYYTGPRSGLPAGVITMEGGYPKDAQQNAGSTSGAGVYSQLDPCSTWKE